MELLLRLFDLFNQTAKNLAVYLPQSGSDLIALFQKAQQFGQTVEFRLGENIGINFQSLLAQLGRIIALGGTVLLDFLKQIVNRM